MAPGSELRLARGKEIQNREKDGRENEKTTQKNSAAGVGEADDDFSTKA